MPQLVVDPESINLGCLKPGEGASSSIKITGGPVIAIVGNDRIKVDPVKIEQEQGIMRIEVQAGVEGDLLWDEIILQRGSEEKRVVVTAWWEYATSEIVVESDQPPVPQGIYTSRESDTKRLYEGRVCLFCGRNRRYDSESRTWLKCEYCKSYNNILHLWIRLVREMYLGAKEMLLELKEIHHTVTGKLRQERSGESIHKKHKRGDNRLIRRLRKDWNNRTLLSNILGWILILSIVGSVGYVFYSAFSGSDGDSNLLPILIESPTPEPTLKPTVTVNPTPTLDPNISRVMLKDGSYLVGADGEPIILVNNPDAEDPSWLQLYNFLRDDPTDKQTYDKDSFTCGDFAEMLHNNAEDAGLTAVYVVIRLGPSELYASGALHALNAFDTTDRGLVYIDSTGLPGEEAGPSGRDKGVNLMIGYHYKPYSIFGEEGWSLSWEHMGVAERKLAMQW